MRILIFLLSLLFLQNAHSESPNVTHKKFEWGAGFLNIYGSHYRGSDQEKLWFFPIPYFTYTSEHIEAEPSFVRGIFFRSDSFEFKLSLMLGLNAESEKNRARAGMPSLDYTLEAGPMFVFHLWQSADKKLDVNFEWPIRYSFATDLSYIKPVGLFTVPYLNIVHDPTPSSWNWSSELSISPMFADQKYHQYFYGVDQQFAQIDRPYYRARGGYSGWQTALVLNKRAGDMVIIPFFRWDYLGNAVFRDSPLVKVKHYTIAGLGLFWIFN